MKQRASRGILSAVILLAGVAIIAVVAARQRRFVRPHTVAEVELPDIVLSESLGHFIALLNTAENEDDPRYSAGLEQLRREPEAIIAEAGRLLDPAVDGGSGNDFALRHSLVLAIAALRSAGALGILAEVALNPQPLPPEPPDTHEAEAAVQAMIVSLDAIDGIEALASDGHGAALDILVAAAATGSNAVRAAALTALGANPAWREQRDKAAAALPAGLRHLGTLQRKAVTDVPQIRDPRATLIEADRGSRAAPLLADDDPYGGDRHTAAANTPRAGRR